jgi:hypothetical protein
VAKDFGISEPCLANWMRAADVEDGKRPGVTRDEARLMALDATRPGGPIGGPAVQAGEIPYVPPNLESYRLT